MARVALVTGGSRGLGRAIATRLAEAGACIAIVDHPDALAEATLPALTVKGIHMSRLYLTVDQMLGNEVLTPALMQKVVKQFIETHDGISDNAYLECRFEFLERRRLPHVRTPADPLISVDFCATFVPA